MPEIVVVATPAATPGFRLGGARTVTATDPEQTIAAVASAVTGGGAAVIAVHETLWARVPRQIREGWEQQARPLVVALPAEDGASTAARDVALRDLLARAIGYQITFTPDGGTP